MANGVQLATAYISLNVRTDDIKKQVSSALKGVDGHGRATGRAIGSNMMLGIREHIHAGNFASILQPIAVAGVSWAAAAGRKIGTALRTAVVTGVSAGIGAALLAGGAVLSAGLARLKTEQEAEIRLSLTLDPASIKDLKNKIREVVKGTPMALDTAFNISVPAVNAGMSNDQVAQYIKDIADLTAATGHVENFQHLAEIMDKVRSKTKLTGEEMQQLIENQVDLRGLLKKGMGWDDKTLNAKIKGNAITFDNLRSSIQKVYGAIDAGNGKTGLAQKAGGSLGGAFGNVKAAMGRLGASILDTLFGEGDDPLAKITRWTGQLTGALDNVTAWFTANKGTIREYFTTAGHAIKGTWEWLKKAGSTISEVWGKAQDIGTKIASGFNTAKDAVSGFIDKIKDIWTNLKTWVVDKWEATFGANSPIGKFMDWLGVGPATANADTGSAPLNRGPMAGAGAGGGGGIRGSFGGSGGGMSTSGSLPLGGAQQGPVAPSAKPGGAGMIKGLGTPYGLPAGTDTGGYGNPAAKDIFPSWVFQLGERFGVKPSTYGGHQEGSGSNQGIDWVGTVDQMQAFAEFLTRSKIPGLEQVIWQNPNTRKPLGLTPDGEVVTVPDGYYRDDWGGHQDHVHTRFNQNLDLSGFASGGHVWGSGSATSDSIPAMLSNGEHVLTAADVKAMGGQQGVYAFRSALQAGLIPGFAPGGAVDPNVVTDAQNNVGALNNAYLVAQAQFNELMAKGDASASELMRAQQNLSKSKRELDNATADLPVIAGGGTPPDRSKQNRVYDITDQLALLQQQLKEQQEAGTEVPYSQQLQQNYQLESLKRDRAAAIGELTGQGQASDYGGDFVRSLGLIPAAAGSSTVAGTSSLAGFINMGNSIVSGVIDTGVNLANTAVSAAIAAGAAAGSFGAGAAAAPAAQMAASYGIQLAGNQAKRISSYWFGLAGIGADAALEIFSPFGVPRALGYDYAGMIPQVGIQEAALGTLEQMGTDAINKHFSGQGGQPNIPADPTAATNTAPSGPSSGTISIPAPGGAMNKAQVGAPKPMNSSGAFSLDLFNPQDYPDSPFGGGSGGGNGGGGSWARGGHVGVYDNGGVLKPGQLAFNASRTPESILTKQQWNAMAANASTKSKDSAPLVQNLYAQDMQDAIRQLEKVKRRDMMQYAGRP